MAARRQAPLGPGWRASDSMRRFRSRSTSGTVTMWSIRHSRICDASSWGTMVPATNVVDAAASAGSNPQHSSSMWLGGSTDSHRSSGPAPWMTTAWPAT